MPQLKKITLNKSFKNKSKKKTQTEVELPSKFELIAEIDRNLKHLQGQRKILQMSKHCKTWANNFTSNQTENRKILNSMSKQTEKCDCKEVCEVLQEVLKKNCVIKITNSSTQFATHLCPEPSQRQCYREPIRVVEESESQQRNSLHSKSENRKSRTQTRKGLHTEITQTKLKPNSDRESKICRHLNKSKTGTPMAHSDGFDLRCNKGLYRACPCMHVVDEGLENNSTRLLRKKERKTLNLPDFLTEQKTLGSTSHSRKIPTETSYKGSVINRTPSSVKRHTKLSEDIMDFARLPKDQRKSRSHRERGHNNYTRLTRKESIISYTKEESTLQNPNKPEQSQNIKKTFRVSEKRTKIKEVRVQHSRRQTIPEEFSSSKDPPRDHLHYISDKIVTSKFLKEELLQDNGKLNANNHTLGSNSLNSNREYIRKQNVIDDNTYICPDNSEENDYLIIPYTNISHQTALTLSPQGLSQNLSNVGLLNKQNEVTERYSGGCSRSLSNYEQRANSSEAHELQKHSVEPISSKPEFSMKIPKQFKAHDENENFSKFDSKVKNEEKFLSQSTPLDHTDFSDYVSHKLESTWESHIHRPNPKSKLVTSRDSHLRASSGLPSHRQFYVEKLTEIGQNGAFQTSEPSGPTHFETTYRTFDHKLNALSKNSSNISAETINITELSRGFEYPTNAISEQVPLHTSEAGKQKIGHDLNYYSTANKTDAMEDSMLKSYNTNMKPVVCKTPKVEILGESHLGASYERQMVNHSVQTEVLPPYHESTSLSSASERWKPGNFWMHTNYMVDPNQNEDCLQSTVEINEYNTNVLSKRDQYLEEMFGPKIQYQSLSTPEPEQQQSKNFLNRVQEFKHLNIPSRANEEFPTSKTRLISNESLIKQDHDTPLSPSSNQSKPMRTEQVKTQPMLISQDNSSIRSPNGSKFCVISTTQPKISSHSISSYKSKPKIEDVVYDTLPLSGDLHLRSECMEKCSIQTEKSKPKSVQKIILPPRGEDSALGAISNNSNLFRNQSADNQFEMKHQSRKFSVEKDYKIPQQRKADVDKGGTKSCSLKTKSAESSLNVLKTKPTDKQIGQSLSFLSLEKRTPQDISSIKEWSAQNFSGFPSSKSLNLNPQLFEVQEQNLRKGENDCTIQLQSDHDKNKSTSRSIEQKDDLQLKANDTKKNGNVTKSEAFIKSNSNPSRTNEKKQKLIRDEGSSQSILETGRNYNINQKTEQFNLSGKATDEEKTQCSNAIGYTKLDNRPSTSAKAMRTLDQTRTLRKDDFECISELELEGCCCNEECCGDLTTDSSEIPTFEGCECMREDYYKIMQIAYNK